MSNVTITCACGAVKGQATPVSDISGVCHCVTCRKWSGGAFMGVSCGSVAYDADAPVKVWKSSGHGERIFCGTCGSTLEWRMQDGSHHSVSAQLFEDPSAFPMRSEIFIDDKPDGYEFVGDHDRLTRAEVIAQYASQTEAPEQ